MTKHAGLQCFPQPAPQERRFDIDKLLYVRIYVRYVIILTTQQIVLFLLLFTCKCSYASGELCSAGTIIPEIDNIDDDVEDICTSQLITLITTVFQGEHYARK